MPGNSTRSSNSKTTLRTSAKAGRGWAIANVRPVDTNKDNTRSHVTRLRALWTQIGLGRTDGMTVLALIRNRPPKAASLLLLLVGLAHFQLARQSAQASRNVLKQGSLPFGSPRFFRLRAIVIGQFAALGCLHH